MSQHGKRNYRPRQNNNPLGKENQKEQQTSEFVVKDTLEAKIDTELKEEAKDLKEEINTSKEDIEISIPEEIIEIEENVLVEEPQHKENDLASTIDIKKEKILDEKSNIPQNDIKSKKEKVLEIINKASKKEVKNKTEEIKVKEEVKKSHYVFDRDKETGEIRRTTLNKKNHEVEEMKIDEKKLVILQGLLDDNQNVIGKLEVEIEIHELIRDKEVDQTKINIIESRIKNYRSSLEDANLRKKSIEELLTKYQ